MERVLSDKPTVLTVTAADVAPGDEVIFLVDGEHHAARAECIVVSPEQHTVRFIGRGVTEPSLPADHPVLVVRGVASKVLEPGEDAGRAVGAARSRRRSG